MTLILRPPGRGNWATVILTIEGRHAAECAMFKIGDPFQLGRQVFRIAGVVP